ncbi:hypothetical protein [Haloarcula salinisoli]|uniref:Uncharacterized protein n=1 Tax=Haloarcula salinisoli TaxID=2487746 RepID=A0A8J7YHM2_9EURY|nr:hypothetical protein [Halomicroarcula salinisoli]MBX0303633.1 hypothetical protein [Halomicroarcula salinisoli]
MQLFIEGSDERVYLEFEDQPETWEEVQSILGTEFAIDDELFTLDDVKVDSISEGRLVAGVLAGGAAGTLLGGPVGLVVGASLGAASGLFRDAVEQRRFESGPLGSTTDLNVIAAELGEEEQT